MGRVRHSAFIGLGIVAASLIAVPSVAAVYYTPTTTKYDFSFAGSDYNNSAGNKMYFSDTEGGKKITITASAWNANKATGATNYTFTKAALEQWSGGLGVTSSYDNPSNCGVGGCNSHEVDNLGNKSGSSSIDFIRLDFSEAVVLGGFGQTVYPSLKSDLSGYQYDADFSIGKLAGANTNVTTSLSGVSNLSTNIFTSSRSVTSCTATNRNPCTQSQTLYSAAQAPYQTASNTWYVAASVLNNYGLDGKPDGFKLASMTAYYTVWTPHQSAVPEPSTWMTMIVGFGVAGGALRRSRRNNVVIAAG